MQTQSGKAYAKINLTLDIKGKREDGYHLIETVMQTISLYDLILIRPAAKAGVQLRCNLPYVPCDSRNIAWKAADAFYKLTGRREHIVIELQKRIPVGAGMAGGSTDAAMVLRLLNRRYRSPLTEEQLYALGLSLGADVPFCLMGGCAVATGIGEQLTAVKGMPKECFLVVCKPRFSISTAQLYQRMDAVEPSVHPDAATMIGALETGDLKKIAAQMGNAMEAAAIPEKPQIAEIRDKLLANGALGAMMTGSGSAVYGIFSSKKQAEAARDCFRGSGIFSAVARPVGAEA